MDKNIKTPAAIRFNEWVRKTGLNKSDLAEKLKYPRTALYNTMNSGNVSPKLQQAIAREFPDTDMNWLLKGTYAATEVTQNIVREPQTRFTKAANMKEFLERDLLKAQVRTADALERLADMFEAYLQRENKA